MQEGGTCTWIYTWEGDKNEKEEREEGQVVVGGWVVHGGGFCARGFAIYYIRQAGLPVRCAKNLIDK